MKYLFILFTLTVVSLVENAATETVNYLAENLKSCHSSGYSQLNQCLWSYYTNALPLLISGTDDGYKLDPLELDNIQLPEVGILISGLVKGEHLRLVGLSNSVVTNVLSDTPTETMIVHMYSPVLILVGRCDINAAMLFVPVISKGNFNATFYDNHITIAIKLDRDGNSVNIDEFDFKFTPSKLKFQFANLVGTDEAQRAIKNMLDDNGVMLYNEVRLHMEKLYTESSRNVFKPLLKRFPTEVF